MSLTTLEIGLIVRQIAPLLSGGRVVRIDQPDRWRVVFHMRNRSLRYWLCVAAHPRFSRLHLLPERPAVEVPAAGFCNVLRQHLTDAPVKAVEQVEDDRVVLLDFVERDSLLRAQRIRLIAELVGTGSNLILVDTGGKILGSLFRENSERRKVVPGVQYQPLPPSPSHARAELNRFRDALSSTDVLSLSRAVDGYYVQLEEEEAFRKRFLELRRRLNCRREVLSRLRHQLGEDLEKAGRAGVIRRKGELLKLAMPDLVKGRDCVVVEDLFHEDRPRRRIGLDPNLSPQENLEKLFLRYKSLKKSVQPLRKRLAQIETELNALEKIADSFNNIAGCRGLDQLEQSAGFRKLFSSHNKNSDES